MALVKSTIQQQIASAFAEVMNDTGTDRQATINSISGKLADAIVNAIRSADIYYRDGLYIDNTNKVIGDFNGNLI